MKEHFQSTVLQSTGASAILGQEVLQELWQGYGQILRLRLKDAAVPSVIVKHIEFGRAKAHPHGWNSDFGHQRKLKSYQVESNWYQSYSAQSQARLPQCYAIEAQEEEILIVLEDLDPAGFPLRKERLTWTEIKACLTWLAAFHASYLGSSPEGLWEEGTYWHLATRPQELEALQDRSLKEAAGKIDIRLREVRYRTLLHGDAKLANFCFSEQGAVAGVDFQYVGGGCGMKDLAYFLGSCLSGEECAELEEKILTTYFQALRDHLGQTIAELETEWRALYPFAWADFQRFLKGWRPGHWKLSEYSEGMTQKALALI